MKKIYVSGALALLIATTSGCVSYNTSQPAAPISGSVTADLKADVKVGEQISGESSTNILFGWLNVGGDTQFADGVTYGGAGGSGIGIPDPISAVKAAAAYKAVKSSGADLIVAPRYEVTVEDYLLFKKVNVKVTGNKGSIASIR